MPRALALLLAAPHGRGDSTKAFLRIALQLKIPATNDGPALAPQASVVASVTSTVGFDFRFPVLAELVSPRGKTPAMPESAVHEHGYPAHADDKIRPAGKVASLRFGREPGAREQCRHNALGSRVASANARHHARSGRRVQEVTAMLALPLHGRHNLGLSP